MNIYLFIFKENYVPFCVEEILGSLPLFTSLCFQVKFIICKFHVLCGGAFLNCTENVYLLTKP